MSKRAHEQDKANDTNEDVLFPMLTALQLKIIAEKRREVMQAEQRVRDKEFVKRFFEEYDAQIRETAERGLNSLTINKIPEGWESIARVLRQRGFKVYFSDEDDFPKEFMTIRWDD